MASSAADAETEADSAGVDSSALVKRKVSDSSGWALIEKGFGIEAGEDRTGSFEGLVERERPRWRWKRWSWG